MADSEEMRRLILHAADRLAVVGIDHDQVSAMLASHLGVGPGNPAVYAQKNRSIAAAMMLAETTLRFVAACMGVEETPPPAAPAEIPAAGPRRTRQVGVS